jgi:hypothetical protein
LRVLFRVVSALAAVGDVALDMGSHATADVADPIQQICVINRRDFEGQYPNFGPIVAPILQMAQNQIRSTIGNIIPVDYKAG